jgi:hypothetical protein
MRNIALFITNVTSKVTSYGMDDRCHNSDTESEFSSLPRPKGFWNPSTHPRKIKQPEHEAHSSPTYSSDVTVQ